MIYRPGPYLIPPEVKTTEDWHNLPTPRRYSDCFGCKKPWTVHDRTGACQPGALTAVTGAHLGSYPAPGGETGPRP